MPHALTPETAARFAQAALGHVAREYPNKLDHVLASGAGSSIEEIAQAVLFLTAYGDYTTGQQININGGIYMR